MTDVKIKYWKRDNPKDNGTVYFATATNAGHARAESDSYAVEISEQEYRQNVPEESKDSAAPVPPAKQAAWQELQLWTQKYGDKVAVQDQIAMLELWKHQLCAWAVDTMQNETQQGVNNVH